MVVTNLQTVSGFDNSKVLSDATHYSVFLCAICTRLVSLESVVADCCSHLFCEKCVETLDKECSSQQLPCQCPICHLNLRDALPLPPTHNGLAVRSLEHSQPLAYKVLGFVQVACQHCTCMWTGNYADFISHNSTHGIKKPGVLTEETESAIKSTSTHATTRSPIESVCIEEKEFSNNSFHLKQDEKETLLQNESNENIPSVENEQSLSTSNGRDLWKRGHSEMSMDLSASIHDEKTGMHGSSLQSEVIRKADKFKKQANAQFNKGSIVEARRLYTEGINLMATVNPVAADEVKLLSDMHANRAVTYFHDKNFDACMDDCDSAIEYEPCLDKAWIRKWRALKAKGEFDKAHRLLRQATYEIPESLKIQEEFSRSKKEMDAYTQAKIYMDAGAAESAKLALQESIIGTDNIALLTFMANTVMSMGDSELALQLVDAACDINPRFVECSELKGLCYFLAGDTEQGMRLLSEAVQEHPTSTSITKAFERVQKAHELYCDALSAVRLGRYSDAIEGFTTTVEASLPLPSTSKLFAILRTDRARSYLSSMKYLCALKDCQEVIKASPEFAPAWVVRADVLIALGKADDARKELLQIRRTWGADDSAVEMGLQRASFELIIDTVNKDIERMQKELDGGCARDFMKAQSMSKERDDLSEKGGDLWRKVSSKVNDGTVRKISKQARRDSDQNKVLDDGVNNAQKDLANGFNRTSTTTKSMTKEKNGLSGKGGDLWQKVSSKVNDGTVRNICKQQKRDSDPNRITRRQSFAAGTFLGAVEREMNRSSEDTHLPRPRMLRQNSALRVGESIEFAGRKYERRRSCHFESSSSREKGSHSQEKHLAQSFAQNMYERCGPDHSAHRREGPETDTGYHNGEEQKRRISSTRGTSSRCIETRRGSIRESKSKSLRKSASDVY